MLHVGSAVCVLTPPASPIVHRSYASDDSAASWRRRSRRGRNWRDRGWVRRIGSLMLERLEDAFYNFAVVVGRGGKRKSRRLPVSRISPALYYAGRKVSSEELRQWKSEWGLREEESMSLVEFVRAYADLFNGPADDGECGLPCCPAPSRAP